MEIDFDRIKQDVFKEYSHRTNCQYNNMIEVLKKENFISERPVVDVGCGCSPHIGYTLAREFGENINIIFNDWGQDYLNVHKDLYSKITMIKSKFKKGLPKVSWELGSALYEPIIAKNSAIIHGTIPRMTTKNGIIIPCLEPTLEKAKDAMIRTLENLAEKQPNNMAIYVDQNINDKRNGAFNSVKLIYNSLEKMGAEYKLFDKVHSLNFMPYRNGSLFIINNI